MFLNTYLKYNRLNGKCIRKIIQDKKETLNLIKKNNSLDSLEKKNKKFKFF